MKPNQPPLAHLEPDADFLPSGQSWSRLKYVALVLHSNVDKHSMEGEVVVRLCNYVDVYKNDRITDDLEYMAATASKSQIKRFSLAHDDVVITKDSETPDDIAVPAYVDASAAGLVCGYHLSILRPLRKVVDGRFLYWAIASKPVSAAFSVRAQGITRFGLTVASTGDVAIPIPPLAEQRAIADFLDRETAKIDALIAAQGELVRTAIQKQTAEADAVLTRGMDGRKLVPSPVPWLGDAPPEWKFVRAKFLFRERSDAPMEDDGVVTAFRDGQVTLRSNRRSEGFTFAELEVGYQHVQQGDLVIHTMDAFAGAIGVSESDGKCTGEYAICIPKDDRAENEYYALLLRLMARRGYIYVLCPSVRERAPRFRFVRFADTMLPVPPRSEQARIVAHIHAIRSNYRALINRCEEQLRLLWEHRSALITAAVTGQVDARIAAEHRVGVAANDNRQAIRIAVGAEIISRHGAAKNFGRVKFQKLLYLAEVHTGISELGGNYVREAAGPLARDLLSETEHGMAVGGFYKAVAPVSENDGVAYERIGAVGAHRNQFTTLLGEKAAPLTKLIDLLKDYSTRDVEAVTTLYAVWNDALLDAESPDDARIIRGFLDEWHPEKRAKFKAADLSVWLGWMRRTGVVPSGSGARTYTDQLFV
jgi:hypothetical protein